MTSTTTDRPTDTPAVEVGCLAPGCYELVPPGPGGVHNRAKRAGWARRYNSPLGTGFVCPTHRTSPGTDSPADPAEPAGSGDAVLVWLPLDQLAHHPDNIRRDLGDLTDLTASIEGSGVHEPLLVLPPDPAGAHLVVAGNRRYAAALAADGVDEVPCVIRDLTLVQVLETMLVENTHRSDVSPVEEARAFARLIALDTTVADIARTVGRTTGYVKTRLAFTQLPDDILDLIHTDQITLRDAELLIPHASDTDLMDQVHRWRATATRPWASASNAIENYLHDRTRDRLFTEARARLNKAGLTEHRHTHWYQVPELTSLTKATPLDNLKLTGPKRAAHRSESCHAVHLEVRTPWDKDTKTRGHQLVETDVCLLPGRHTADHPEANRSAVQMAPATYAHLAGKTTPSVDDEAARERRALLDARQAAREARHTWVHTQVTGDRPPTTPIDGLPALFITADILQFELLYDIADRLTTTNEALTDAIDHMTAGLDDPTPDTSRITRAWIHCVAEDTIAAHHRGVGALTSVQRAVWLAYLDLLQGEGYELSPIETADRDRIATTEPVTAAEATEDA